MTAGTDAEFAGTSRFEVIRRLGAGGMGVVYQVYDRERARAVALKTLRRRDAAALYRFKREFRGLADIAHPNLAALHELVSSGDEWFFTMELVEGVDFIRWVRDEEQDADAVIADTEPEGTTRRSGTKPLPGEMENVRPAEVEVASFAAPPSPPGSYERLRDGLSQLAAGVHALHQAGKLHRDIKPSNVMVDRGGRVVLLDFGLITEVARAGGGLSDDQHIVGTVGYMSPEQGASMPLGPASDWYSVGTVLYRALTGRLPFAGPPLAVLMEKRRREPTCPHQLLPGTPMDLSQLCSELLRVDAAARPDGDEILRRLGGHPAAAGRRRPSSARCHDGPLVGRAAQAAALRDAFAATSRDGRAATVLVQGRSGMGKSMLMERVTDELAREHDALVLAGRCHERESVPYKALDSVIDSLSRHLARLPDHEVEALLPRDALAIARLFPVLRRLRSIKVAPRRAAAPDPHELRRRGLAALRELVARMADRRPLVVAIDDLQWGDLDSSMLLLDLLRPPDPPAPLLLLAFRSEEAEGSESVRTLVEGLRALGSGAVDVREVKVGALAPEEARDLVRLRLRDRDGEHESLAGAIARESGGDPFLIDQLVRSFQAAGMPAGEITVGDVTRTQLEQLGPEARRVLELVAVAARPLPELVLAHAAGLEPEREDQVMAVLRAASLVRTSGATELGRIETYHDRIRDAVIATLTDEQQRACHMALADALEWSERADPEALAVHLLGAGDVERGTEYAIEAAGNASAALAFERAAVLYRLAIDALPPDVVARRGLRAALGDALVNAGRGADAAAEYMAAAENSPPPAGLDLRRRAAEQLLRCGRADEGLSALDAVLQEVGMNLPATPRRAIWSFLRQRLRAWLRAMRYRERDRSQISDEHLSRIDICWSVAIGIGMTDPVRGVAFQTRHLSLALAAGEPYRVSRALAMEVCYTSVGSGPTRAWTQKLLARAREISDRIDEPHTRALAAMARGMVDYQNGQWGAALSAFEETAGILRAHCTGVAFEIGTAQRLALDSLFYMGSLGELCRRVPQHLAEAERRGDLYVTRDFCTGLPNAAWLVMDDPVTARAECERGRRYRSQAAGFYLQHYYELVASTHIDLYAGDGESAYRRIVEQWPRLHGSMLLRFRLARVMSLFLRGRAALSAATQASGDARARLLADVDRTARRLARQAPPGAPPQASTLAAGAAHLRGHDDRAVQLLAGAESRFQTAEMHLAAAATRYRRGEMIAGTAGDRLRADAEAWMRTQSIRNPAAMTRLIC